MFPCAISTGACTCGFILGHEIRPSVGVLFVAVGDTKRANRVRARTGALKENRALICLWAEVIRVQPTSHEFQSVWGLLRARELLFSKTY